MSLEKQVEQLVAGSKAELRNVSRDRGLQHRDKKKFNTFIRINKQKRSSSKHSNLTNSYPYHNKKRGGGIKVRDDARHNGNHEESECERAKGLEIETLLAQQRLKAQKIHEDVDADIMMMAR